MGLGVGGLRGWRGGRRWRRVVISCLELDEVLADQGHSEEERKAESGESLLEVLKGE